LATGLAAGLAAALATGFADALAADLTTALAAGFADGLATALAVDFTAGLAAALLAGLAGVLVLVADTGLAFVTGLGAFLAAALGATFVVLGAGFLDLRSAGMGTPRLQRNKKSAPKTQRDNRKGKGKPLNGKGSGRTFGVQSLR
jgi:L-fucose isomerase-like protein